MRYDAEVGEALKEAAHKVLDIALDDEGSMMVTKAVLIVEAVNMDGQAGTLQIGTEHPIWDLLGLVETARSNLKARVIQIGED